MPALRAGGFPNAEASNFSPWQIDHENPAGIGGRFEHLLIIHLHLINPARLKTQFPLMPIDPSG